MCEKGFLMQACKSLNACFYVFSHARLSAYMCVYAYLCRKGCVSVCCRLRRRMKWHADGRGSPLLYQEDSTAGEEDEGSWPGLIKKKKV